MEEIVIVIEEGLVRNVYSSKENVALVILDLDTEEGLHHLLNNISCSIGYTGRKDLYYEHYGNEEPLH